MKNRRAISGSGGSYQRKIIRNLACQAKRFGSGLCCTPKCTDALSSQRNAIHDGIYHAGRSRNGNTNKINKTLSSRNSINAGICLAG